MNFFTHIATGEWR